MAVNNNQISKIDVLSYTIKLGKFDKTITMELDPLVSKAVSIFVAFVPVVRHLSITHVFERGMALDLGNLD